MAGGKEFFFLQLDAFPRRIAQHAIKTPRSKHLRKGNGPVEDAGGFAHVLRVVEGVQVLLGVGRA